MAGEYLLDYKARKYYSGNGSQLDFLITFPGGNPIETSHVKVFVNGTELTSAWSVVGYGGNNYVRFQTPPNGATAGNVLLKRVTPDTEATRVVDFVGGSLLKAEDLDRSQLNCLYVSQESADLFLDQGGSAVNTTFDQSIAGVKTFTGTVKIADSAEMIFKPTTIPISLIGGVQYVLAAKASDGSVGWEETLLQRLPDNVVLTDGPAAGQEILTAKKFSGSVELANAVKITVGAAADKVLTSDGAGNASWAKVVNGVRLGSSTALIKDGIVTITAADIGVLGGVEVDANGVSQVTGPVDFDGSISVGDAGLDNLVINASIKIPTNAGAGKVLTSNADGFCAWSVPTSYVTSVNGYNGAATGGAVTLNATDVGAVSVSTTQTITGAKTFTGNTVIGAVGGANTVEVLATLKYPVSLATTGQAGRILTSTIDGTAYWSAPPALGVVEINGITGSVVNLIPSNIGAVSSTAAENVAGVKTFTAIPVMNAGITVNNTFRYNVGSTAAGKFLTSDASGNASWAFVPASGITSINGDTGTNGAAIITAAGLGAVSTATTQTITGNKTFDASVVLGTTTLQTITVNSPLKYNIGLGVGGNQEGQVLTSTADGTCVWQIPEPAGVSTVNGASGVIEITAAGLGAYTAATIPQTSINAAGIIQLGTGFYQDPTSGIVNVQIGGSFPIATRHDDEEPSIGGVMIGDNLTINPTTGRLDAMSGASGTHVTSFLGMTGAVTSAMLTSSQIARTTTNTFSQSQYFQQEAISYGAFRAIKSLSLYPSVAGGSGVQIYATPGHATLDGTVRVQNTTSTNDIWRGYTSGGGITSQITGEGNAKFSGVVEAVGGFKTSGGISIGDNVIDEITLKGTIKIPAGAAADYVLRCTSDTDATGALIGKAVWSPFTAAPVQSVNGIVGTVVITADGTNGLGAVTKDTTQLITGVKTFSANALFNGDVAIGNAYTDLCTVTSNLKLLNNGSTGVGKVWTCSNTDGSGGWVTPTTYITSVNGSTGTAGAVIITAGSLGAVTTTGTQTVAGDKTFTGTVNLQGNVVVGTTETTNITISSAIKIATGAVAGKYLTCVDTTGACQWSDAAQAPVSSVNGRVGAVVITADGSTDGIGAVTKSTQQTITGEKTFSAVTSFTEAVTLGDGLADIITISGTLKIAQDAVIGKVLTCGTAGVVAWQPPLITSVITKIGTTITATQVGEVIIDAAKIGAATTAQLDTATAAIATAQTTANNAATAAATAQSTADSKLAAVATTTTANPVSGTLLDCLSGNGTSGSPLKVLGALPIGGINSGDLTGSYPSPTIGAGKVTYAKMQTVAAQRLLGNATSTTQNVTEIQLGSGLTWAAGKLDTTAKGDAVLSAANSFTNSNSFGGTTTCAALTTTGAVILGDAAADTLTVNATSSFQNNITVAAGKVISTPYLKMTTSPAAGLVLTSDASGNASWAAPTGTTSSTANTWTAVVYTSTVGYWTSTWAVKYQAGCPFTVTINSPSTSTISGTVTGVSGQTWSYVLQLMSTGGASSGSGYVAHGSVTSTSSAALTNTAYIGSWSTANSYAQGTIVFSRTS